MNKHAFLLTCVFLLLAVSLHARGNREEPMPPPPDTIQVTGTVRLVGTALFPEIVISNDEGSWYIAADERDKLHNLQHRTVIVEGEETVTELTFANGIPAGTRRELKNVVVLQIE